MQNPTNNAGWGWWAAAKTNCLAVIDQCSEPHGAIVQRCTHDQYRFHIRCEWLQQCHSLPTNQTGVNHLQLTYNQIMAEYVQVRHSELLDYIAHVEHLSKDHTQLQEQVKDAKELASIIEKTYKTRLDQLMDLVLELHPSNYQYQRGLIQAYNVLAGHLE